ncbi:MAG TPA: PQQ-binding-like beta-propeller repeat protein [Aldersonia sp.]
MFVVGILISLAPIVVTLEERGALSALKRSIALVRPALGRLVVLHMLWVAVVFAAFFVTATFAIVVSFAFSPLSVLFLPLNLVVVVLVFPVFRTLQTLIYTDLLIREGTYRAGRVGRPVGLGANNSAEKAPAPFFAAEPYHAARVAAEPPRTATPAEYAQFAPIQPQYQYGNPYQPLSAQHFWPPAPPGGNTPPKDHPRRRGPLAIIAVIGVLALVVSSGAVWWLVNRDESMPAVEATGQLRNPYPAAPTATWVVDAGQIFSRAQFAAPIPSPTGSNTPGFINLGDTLVTTAYLPQTDRGADLVAIDSESGTVRWTAPIGFDVTCASRTVDDLLPCFRTQGFVDEHVEEVVFLNMSDGSVDHRIAASGIERIEVVGDDIVTAGYHGIARGSTTDLTEHWSTPWEPRDSCPGSGDAQYFGADDEFVHFGTDAGSLVVRARDGKRVIDSDAQQVTVYPGHGVVAEVCRGGDPDNRLALVLDGTGALLRSHASDGGFTSPLALDDESERYVVDGTAYDFSTGTQAWSYGSAVTDIVDHTALVLTGGPLTAVDLDTGDIRWTHDFDPVESYTVPFMWMTDRERVLFEVDDDLRAVNLTDGALEWTTPISDGTPRPAGYGFAVASDDAIVYYAPTGGSAGATPAPQTGTESTQLVTKCGKAPEMTPVQYRTDTAGLVVRMELRARCPGGDILSTDALRVSISENGQPIAAGVFDVSSAPIYLPPTDSSGTGSTVEHEFYFPVGSFWRLPNSIGNGTARDAQRANGSRTQVVECVDTGTSRGPSKGEFRGEAAVGATIATNGVLPTLVDAEAAALDALRAQANADRASVQSDLADRWVPQLSSKRVGLVAPDVDGRMVTWSATEILNQHLRMRLQYPEVRLVWSDEWRTFDLRGWWVTIAGATFPDASAANGWCDSRGIAVDECFAKLISNTRDSSGTTQYRR